MGTTFKDAFRFAITYQFYLDKLYLLFTQFIKQSV